MNQRETIIHEEDEDEDDEGTSSKDQIVITNVTYEQKDEGEDEQPSLSSELPKVNIQRDSINVLLIGYVDTGKNTLSNIILQFQNEEDISLLEKIQHNADTTRTKSATSIASNNIDVQFDDSEKDVTDTYFDFENRNVVLNKALTHKKSIPNMIAIGSQADCAALLISACKNEFENGFINLQAQGHVKLAKELGIGHLICIINKMDSIDWDQEQYNSICNTVEPYLINALGFTSVQSVPISCLLNQNINTHVTCEASAWYTGGTLFDAFNKVPLPTRNPNGPLRIPVIDVISEKGKKYLFGKIESGKLVKGQQACVMSSKKTIQIMSIYDSKGQQVKQAIAGDCIKVEFEGFEEKDFQANLMVCETDNLCFITQLIIAEITLFDLRGHKPIVVSGYNCTLNIHTSASEATIEEVQTVFDPAKGVMVKKLFMKSQQKGVIKISTKNTLCLEKFETNEQLGRFLIYDEYQVIGSGKVIKIKPFQI